MDQTGGPTHFHGLEGTVRAIPSVTDPLREKLYFVPDPISTSNVVRAQSLFQAEQPLSRNEQGLNHVEFDRRYRARQHTIHKSSKSQKLMHRPLELGYWGSLNCAPNVSRPPFQIRGSRKPAYGVRSRDQPSLIPFSPLIPDKQHGLEARTPPQPAFGYPCGIQPPSDGEMSIWPGYNDKPLWYPADEERSTETSDEKDAEPNINPTLDSIVSPWGFLPEDYANQFPSAYGSNSGLL